MHLQTKNLKLLLQSPDDVRAQLARMSPEDRAQVSPVWLARIESATAPDPWIHGFRVVRLSDNAHIGQCGFKAPPDSERIVEIAYCTNPEHCGQGYATEAAAALVRYAFSTGQVRLICAHTLPEGNASTHVLTKCGFARTGEVIDPEDGLVWRWEISH